MLFYFDISYKIIIKCMDLLKKKVLIKCINNSKKNHTGIQIHKILYS